MADPCLVSGVLALAFAFWKASWVNRQDPGNEKMIEIGKAVREGAMAFLFREYRVLAIFVVVVAVLLFTGYLRSGMQLIALSFVVGALCSGLAGFIGMRVATAANNRTTQAARGSLNAALGVAFSGGTVMGMGVVGLGVIGLSLLWIFYGGTGANGESLARVVQLISGFSLGASSIALFARVGGGIFTKAADVGADLVGKVEAGIPEDDPRNPATIADNVGDNVGDVAGMGADLFESYVGSIVGAMVLATAFGAASNAYALLPLVIAGVGIVASILGTFLVRTKEGGNPQAALNTGTGAAAVLTTVASWFVIQAVIGDASEDDRWARVRSAHWCFDRVLHRGVQGARPKHRLRVQDGERHEHHSRARSRHDVHRASGDRHRSGDHRLVLARGPLRDRDRCARNAGDHRDPARGGRVRPDRRQRRRMRRDGRASGGSPAAHG
jgi:K(+)-stimulated pyrophosphate-energized sodium pump